MADLFIPDAFYTSAQDFALRALEAHHSGDHRCVSLFAGTAVEHLAKACLARRSPALLIDLTKGRNSFDWLAALLRVEGGGIPAGVRTVGLNEALQRMGRFITSKADQTDLQALIDMRNGVIHAAEDTVLEERILTAFVQQADALLADLGRDRAGFWEGQLPVVNALLTGASDKLKLQVEMKLAAATARVDRLFGSEGEAVLRALREFSKTTHLDRVYQRFRGCPVCGSDGIAAGEHSVVLSPSDWEKDQVTSIAEQLWFTAEQFHCQVCNLRLDSEAEIDAAGIDPRWQIEDEDWRDYYYFPDPSDDDDAAYERWRDERSGR